MVKETLQRQRKSKYISLEGSNVAVANTVLTTPRFFHLEIFINIVSHDMAEIESFHQEKLGMTKYDKITALFMDAMNRQLSRK